MKHKNTQNAPNKNNNSSDKSSSSGKNDLVKKEIFGVEVTDAKKEKILEYIVTFIQNSSKNCYITTPNPEMLVFAKTHPDFKHILNDSQIALCDGVGLLWASKVLREPLQERFTGVEMVEKLCEKVNDWPITVGFFGGRPGVAELTADCLKQKYPKLKILLASDVWEEKGRNAASPDILFVALGFPKQEEWMAAHINKIPVRVMIGVGGAFDYISGKVPRAPSVVRSVGLEWLFRLVVQPWRLRRQLALPQFAWMVLKEQFVQK